MLRLKRSFLLLFVLFLAACGTQTPLPEVVTDNSASIEIATSGKANVYFKKWVEGHAPKGAKYKIELICRTTDKHQKVILKQTVDIHKYKGYTFKKSYYGVNGFKCVVREVGNEHKDYYVGDHVIIKVKQNSKHIGYVAKNTKNRYDTVETPKFHVGKRGDVYVYVTNKFKKEDKTKLSFVKSFYDVDSKEKVSIGGEAKFYLICKDKYGKAYKDVFSFGGEHGYYYHNAYSRGLNCYLKESFYDEHYELVGVHFASVNYVKK